MKCFGSRALGMIVWLLTAIGCIHIGLMAMGHDLLMMVGMHHMGQIIGYIFGIAGVLSLVMFVMSLTKDHCDCDCK
jgi:uncharacterized membrane protein YuzA (DUF378 family)